MRRAVPNFLTVLRILLIPLSVFYLTRSHPGLALVSYAILAITDFMDGYLARRWHAVSRLGSFLDQASDKLVGLVFFSALMVLGDCPVWFTGLISSVFMLQMVGYIFHYFPERRELIHSLWIGKWNMALQYIWIGVLIASHLFPPEYLNHAAFHWTRFIGFILLALLQLAVFFAYFFHIGIHHLPRLRTFKSH